jgi:RNA recognition motif-containing protein
MDAFGGGKRGTNADEFEATEDKRQKMSPPSKVLHVRALPPFTSDTELAALFSPFGRVVRSLVLQEKAQAFLQMDSIESATKALNHFEYSQPVLRDKTIYVQFSSRQEVDNRGQQNPSGPAVSMEGASPTLIFAISNVMIPVTLDNIYSICKPYGEVQKIITFNKGPDFQALVQFASPDQAANARAFLDDKDLFQGCCHIRVSFSKRQTLTVRQNDHKSRDYTVPGGHLPHPAHPAHPGMMGMAMPMHQMGAQMGGMGQMMDSRSPVVIVNKLDEQKVTPEILFTLFGVYGDVQRIKIMFNKRDTALVQFATGEQAEYARQNLHGCPLFGQNLHVATSRFNVVQLPQQAAEAKDLTRDFTNSPFHRFARKAFINPKNVNPPSAVLHLANIHEGVTGQELRDLFTPHSASGQPPAVEFFKTNRSQAYLAMEAVEDAVMALINLHNYKVQGYPLRISFSHKEVGSIQNSE